MGASAKIGGCEAGYRGLRQYFPLGLVAWLGIGLSVLAFTVVDELKNAHLRADFVRDANDEIIALRQGIASYLEVLHSIRSHFAASSNVERRDFHTFVEQALKRHPGIQALEWIPRVPASQRAAYEQAARKDGYPDFQITEREAQGHMVPAASRDEYFPVYYVEPFEGNEIAFGFDLTSNPSRLETLNGARDSGQAVASGRTTLVQESGDQFGFLVFLPIYRNGVPHETVAQRRENLTGFALAVFRTGDMVESILQTLTAPAGFDIYLYDTTAGPDERFLYYHPSRLREEPSRPLTEEEIGAGLHWATTFEVAGRRWRVLVEPLSRYVDAQRQRWQAWGMLVGGLTITAMLVAYLLTWLRRIAERERAEEALKESETRYRELFEQAPIGFWEEDYSAAKRMLDNLRGQGVHDFRRYFREHREMLRQAIAAIKIVDINQAGLNIFHAANKDEYFRFDADSTGWRQPLWEFYVEELAALAEGQSTFAGEYIATTLDGSTVVVSSITYIGDAYRATWSRVVSVAEDITERKRVEEEVRTQAIELARSNRELDDFAYIASHDLKEPLRGIHNYSTFLLEDYGDRLDDEGKAKLETLTRLTQRMEDLIDDLLMIARVGRTKLGIKRTNLNDLVSVVVDSLQTFLEESGVEIRIPRSLPTMRCDETLIGQVFQNLITNAAKYNDKSERWIEIGYRNNDRAHDSRGTGQPNLKNDDEIPLYVRDNGMGIPEKHLDSIFRMFKRLHGRAKYGGGTGAGMTIVKKIVERHGGQIWVESEVGKGTTFYFTLGESES